MKYFLLLPALLFAAVFTAWPMVRLIEYSLLKTDFIDTSFVGLANYVKALTNPAFLRSWLNSFFYILFMVVGNTTAALAISLSTFTLAKRWHDTVRIIFYVPQLSAGIIIAQVWRWVFHHDGPVNWLISVLGGEKQMMFLQAKTAIPAVSLIVIAAGVGGSTIMLLAAILGIDNHLYDAARIDGATWRRIKRSIVLPQLRPIIGLITLMSMIGGLQIFETIYALAPHGFSATVTFHVYREAFVIGRYGLASAQAVILLVVTVGLTLAKRRIEG